MSAPLQLPVVVTFEISKILIQMIYYGFHALSKHCVLDVYKHPQERTVQVITFNWMKRVSQLYINCHKLTSIFSIMI